MSKKLVMPARKKTDGAVNTTRLPDGDILVSIVTAGIVNHITMSEHNAWRMMGSLHLLLEIPFHPTVGKVMKL